jgi:signal transduction histidine kinase
MENRVSQESTSPEARAYAVLLALSEGTARMTGAVFFRALVQQIAQVLDVTHVFITECTDAERTRVRSLAYWQRGSWMPDIEYALEGTPCQQVIRGETRYQVRGLHRVFFPEGLHRLFPDEAGLESYLGIPLFDTQQEVIGHLVIMDEKPIADQPLVQAVLRIFALRASAEMLRIRQETARAEALVLQRRTQVAESLRDILRVLNSDQPLTHVLDFIVKRACTVLGAAAGKIILTAHHETAAPAPEFPTRISLPLTLQNETFGEMVLYYTHEHRFSEEEWFLAGTLGEYCTLALENDRLRQQAKDMAVMEERNRIARELHDAISQTLWSIGLIADVLPDIWQHDAARGLAKLEQLRYLTRTAWAEMRALLLELRPAMLTGSDVRALLNQLTQIAASRMPLDIHLDVEGMCQFSPDVQIAVYRITQEALNNIIRHASASIIHIVLRCTEARFVLTISDNGIGFDPHRPQPGHHGIAFMRERADLIGAHLMIGSQPGAGTILTLSGHLNHTTEDHP